MAIAQAWQRKWQGELPYGTALKQGTGWNSVHSIRGGAGRDIAPDGTENLVPEELTPEYADYGYTSEDAYLFGDPPGYGAESPRETGMQNRPDWGMPEGTRADVPPNYPSWGTVNDIHGNDMQLPAGIPGGTIIRAEENGAVASTTANVLPDETVNQGWENKVHGTIADSQSADPSQLIIQTSDVQRYQVREGSQTPEGRASEYDAPIASRVVGQKVKLWTPAGEERHYDMAPKAQEQMIRPFEYRTAGTGDPLDMSNPLYASEPYQRTVPSDAYQGPVLPVSQAIPNDTDALSYGFTQEDAVW